MSNDTFHAFKEKLPGLTYVGAIGHVFKLIHYSHAEHLAWCPEKKWTQFRNGKVYSYNEAVDASISGTLPDEGRWFAIGCMIYSVE